LLADGLELAYEKLSVSGESKKEIIADAILRLEDVTFELEKQISKLAPFGMENEKPVFAFQGVEISAVKVFGKSNEHLEISFLKKNLPAQAGGGKISAISFFTKAEDFDAKIKVGEKVDLLGTLDKSNFRGKAELRLRIVDIFQKIS
jgi:single-stranded-DNA-specific exonuclease